MNDVNGTTLYCGGVVHNDAPLVWTNFAADLLDDGTNQALEQGNLTMILNSFGIDTLFNYVGTSGGGSLSVNAKAISSYAASQGEDFDDALDDITSLLLGAFATSGSGSALMGPAGAGKLCTMNYNDHNPFPDAQVNLLLIMKSGPGNYILYQGNVNVTKNSTTYDQNSDDFVAQFSDYINDIQSGIFIVTPSCPTGGTYQNETCVCDNSTYTLDAIGQCQPPCAIDTFGVGGMCTNCPIFSTSPSGSPNGTYCTCTESETVNFGSNSDGTPNCVCDSGFVTRPTGCETCPARSTFNSTNFPNADENTCGCTDLYAAYNVSENTCQCQGATYQDPFTTACLLCGIGTNSNSTGCVCVDPAKTLDADNNCYLAPTLAGQSLARKAKRARALVLQSIKTTPWQELEDEALCPSGETACPVFPSMVSYECIDISSELESCGGCQSLGKGVDCLATTGVVSATCVNGICEALSCTRGWEMKLGDSLSASECIKRQ